MMDQFYTQSFFPINNNWAILGFIVLGLWILFWKGCSLWIATKNDKKLWFAILLIFNTIGILEIIFIFFVAKKKWSDIKEIFSKTKQTEL